MRSSSKRIVAVMVVTAALCADQVVASPLSRPDQTEFGNIAQRLVGRLAQNLRTVIPATRCWAIRRPGIARDPLIQPVCAADPSASHIPFPPFRFRLPPPAV